MELLKETLSLKFGLVGLALALSSASLASDWALHALRLTGGSDKVTANSLAALKKIPALDIELKQALQTSRAPLALDVISTLEITKLLPDLLEMSASDRDGFIYQTI